MKRSSLILALLALLAGVGAGEAQREPRTSPHGTLRPGLDCADCHTSEAWRPARADMRFDHASASRFPLEGKHALAACAACHIGLRFDQPRTSVRDCGGCHADVHRGRLGADCAACHDTESFADAKRIQVHARTNFPLTGVHAQIQCESCHRDGRAGAFTALDPRCVSCHGDEYRIARLPDHAALGFPRECEQCHGTLGWRTASFDHAALAGGFALVGAHAREPCTSCHLPPDDRLVGRPEGADGCVGCHRADHQREHPIPGYPTGCLRCHTVETWSGATFEHASLAGGFALVGAHAQAPCSACHAPPDGRPIFDAENQNDCVACHRADYQREHEGSGFPTTCTTCHSTSTWGGAVFDHDRQFFPIYSGPHREAWSGCQSCHPGAPVSFGAFTCLTCHGRAETDRNHDEVSGYAYESNRCLACHPRGDG